MLSENLTMLMLSIFVTLNVLTAILFWLHERLEYTKANRLRESIEKAVRAVEQVCSNLSSPEKKREAVLRVQALLGWYRVLIPDLVIDTAIEAEVYLINQLRGGLSVDHDTPEEVAKGEGSN
jgi:hypothetical protein